LAKIIVDRDSFIDPGEARERLASFSGSVIREELVGKSEEGRPIYGYHMGSGRVCVSLIGGSHADEPVGPDTLRRFLLTVAERMIGGGSGVANAADSLVSETDIAELLETYSFHIIPHVNPDGEAANRVWADAWPDLVTYTRNVVREIPGRDIEFGYPDRRQENKAVSAWLSRYSPFDLHMSLHGMGFSDGTMLLIEKNWAYRTEELQAGFAAQTAAEGLTLHDHNRKGEKGFFQIAPGFTTTPEGFAMRTFFESRGDSETAGLFSDSSMEYVRGLGGDPLCLVTEMPLFLVDGMSSPGSADAYVRFRKEYLPRLRLASISPDELAAIISEFGLRELSLPVARRLQLTALDLGLATVARASSV
jgi:Zinc carboxypeptidase